jgi:hypothetical protein
MPDIPYPDDNSMIVDPDSGTIIGNAPNRFPTNKAAESAATSSEARGPDEILEPRPVDIRDGVDNFIALALTKMGYVPGADPKPYINALRERAAGVIPLDGETIRGNAPNFRPDSSNE